MIAVKHNRYLIILRYCVALFLISFLFISVGIEEIVGTFLKINPAVCVLAACCLFALFLLGAFNLWLLLNAVHHLTFIDFLKVYTNSWFVSLVMPGQAGDASIIIFLKKQGVPLTHSSIVYMMDKFITLSVFLVVSSYGSHILFPELNLIVYFLFFPLLGSAFLLLIFLFLSLHIDMLGKIKAKFGRVLYESVDLFQNKWRILVINVLLTFLKWLITSLGFYFAFYTFGVRIDIAVIAIIPILSTLVGYIPISIAGLGTVEVTAAYFFSMVHIQQSVVVNSYLLLRILQYGLAILLIAASSLIITKSKEKIIE